jgi:hypothetical protein
MKEELADVCNCMRESACMHSFRSLERLDTEQASRSRGCGKEVRSRCVPHRCAAQHKLHKFNMGIMTYEYCSKGN